MRFLGQRFVAAAVGVLALSALAVAQSPTGSTVARPAKSYRMALPGEAAAPVPAAEEVTWTASVRPVTATTVETPAPLPPVAVTNASTYFASTCTTGTCGKSASSSILSGVKARLFSSEYGYSNPVGCGTCQSERTFLFGSCCQFFKPGRECGSCGDVSSAGCASGGCGSGYWSKCPRIIYGPGTGTPMNPCVYDSYLNH